MNTLFENNVLKKLSISNLLTRSIIAHLVWHEFSEEICIMKMEKSRLLICNRQDVQLSDNN